MSSDACDSSFLLSIPVRWLGEVEVSRNFYTWQNVSLEYSSYLCHASRFLCGRWKRERNLIVSKFWNAWLLLTDYRHSILQINFLPRKLFVWLSVIEGTSIWGNWTHSDAWRRNVSLAMQIYLLINFILSKFELWWPWNKVWYWGETVCIAKKQH